MDNYESFRDTLYLELEKVFPDKAKEERVAFLNVMDVVMKDYTITRKTTDLILYEEGVPKLVKEFVGSKAVEGKSKGTLQNYTFTLSNFFRRVNKDVTEITANDIRVYFHQYQQERNVSWDTIETMRHVLNSFFTWAMGEEYVKKDPTKHISAIKTEKKERPYLEDIELEYIREACQDAREKAIVDFLFSTGCRVSEMCNVKMNDVNFDKRTVYIRCGKGKKSRTTFVNAEAMVSLRAYLKQRDYACEYLFTHKRRLQNQHLNKKAVEMMLRNIVARCPQITKKVTPHVIRHTAATRALRSGMPIEQVKEFLGHSNLNTTLIYAKINKDDVRRSHEMIFG